MKYSNEGIDLLEQQLANDEEVCCSYGNIATFPEAFFDNFRVADIGLIVCVKGQFTLSCEGTEYDVHSDETAFFSRGVYFSITSHSADCTVIIIHYRIDSIRNILGSTVVGMKFLEMNNPKKCRVMHTGHEAELAKYSELLSAKSHNDNAFAAYEHKLLLLSLTYRLCSIFSSLSDNIDNASNRKMEIYIELIQLIDKHYAHERGVRFYADKLCLSPKYLTSLVKSISGNTVQQLVFKAIIKKAIFLVTSTDKSIKEISDYLNFPNASAFGTFFKKQLGMSPINYREKETKGNIS